MVFGLPGQLGYQGAGGRDPTMIWVGACPMVCGGVALLGTGQRRRCDWFGDRHRECGMDGPTGRTGYGQYCPITRAVEVLGERWSVLIIRDLLCGVSRFNELARSNPRLSRTLLSTRLRQLEQAGIIEHISSRRVGSEVVVRRNPARTSSIPSC